MSLRVGVVVVQNLPWAAWLDRVLEVERLGYDSVLVWDHVVHRTQTPEDPLFEPFSLLGAAAQATTAVRLGTLVASPTMRHPLHLAKAAMTLDQVSGGRFELGIGAAGVLLDYQALGIQPWSRGEQVERFTETVELVDVVLRGGSSYTGKHWSGEGMTAAPGCVQSPRVPLVLAAHGPRTLRLAGRLADTWNSYSSREAGPDEALEAFRSRSGLLEEAAGEAGRDPATIGRSVLVGSDAWPVLASPEAFREAALRWAEAGATEVVLMHPGHPAEVAVGHGPAGPDVVRRIAEEVLPSLRAELG